MSAERVYAATMPTVIKLHPVVQLTDDQFFAFCQANADYQFERTVAGELVVMSPTGSESGQRNASLTVRVGVWAEQDGSGLIFDSSTGFTLPNGAIRSPDLAWIQIARWEAIPGVQRKKFAPICPDFVVELRSETDDLAMLQAKMQEYLENGAKLGWLLDPIERQVYVYCSDAPTQKLDNPTSLSGDPVLAGFVLNLSQIW